MNRFGISCIACMVDFSALSRDGLEIAIRLARRFSSELVIFHAVGLPGDRITGSDYSLSRPMQTRHVREARKRLKEWAAGFDRARLWITEGDPVEGLREAAGRYRLDLIVAPSTGGSGIRRLFAGTLVERLVRSIDVPVLITRPNLAEKWNGQVLIGRMAAGVRLDRDSENGLLRCASRIAGDFQAWLHVVHILEFPPDLECGPYERNQRVAMEDLAQKMMRTAGKNRMDSARMVTRVLTGTPGEVIHRYIQETGIDLVVVGVRQIGKFRKNVIGSTTEYLLRYAPGMVLTVPVDRQGDKT